MAEIYNVTMWINIVYMLHYWWRVMCHNNVSLLLPYGQIRAGWSICD